MINRRLLLASTLSAFSFRPLKGAAQDNSATFEELLNSLRVEPDIAINATSVREGAMLDYNFGLTRSAELPMEISNLKISDKALDMIVAFEVSSRQYYEQKLRAPIWPGGNSGVTIGIGYDLGYASISRFTEQWSGRITDEDISLLEPTCEAKGEEARLRLPSTEGVSVSWDTAVNQFREIGLPRYVGKTKDALPTLAELPEDSRGALVSLVYNRGASFRLRGERFKEMRNIRQHMNRRDFDKVPSEIRSMKRIWEGLDDLRGLVIRREMEAQLFERGLGELSSSR